jgi:hypothetical protein
VITTGERKGNMKKQLSLSEKIFRISRECPTIPRNGVGEQADPNKPLYPYVKIEDVLDAINPLLRKYKLILTGNVPKEPMMHVGKTFATSEVLIDWTLVDVENNVSQTYRVPGAGCDDSGKGIFKAMTGSRKYACVLIFNLRFGDEPEQATAQTPKEQPSAPRSES